MLPSTYFAIHADAPAHVVEDCRGFETMRAAWLSKTTRLLTLVWLAGTASWRQLIKFDARVRLVDVTPHQVLRPLADVWGMAAAMTARTPTRADVLNGIYCVASRAQLVAGWVTPADPAVTERFKNWLRELYPSLFLARWDELDTAHDAEPPASLTWTTARPTAVGWYWARRTRSMDDKPEVVQVRMYAEKLAVGNCSLSALGYDDYE